MRRALRIAVGVVLLVVGLAGLVLPLLQGWLLIALAIVILAPEVPALARWRDRLAARFPALQRALRRFGWKDKSVSRGSA